MPNAQRSGSWKLQPPPLGLDPNAKWQVDPYLVWAEATGYAGYPPEDDGAATLPVLLELAHHLSPDTNGGPALLAEPGQDLIPEVAMWATLEPALHHSRSWAPNSRYHTAFVKRGWLPILVQLQRLGALARFQLGAARGKRMAASRNNDDVHITNFAATQTLGVVDDGCCIAHDAFRDDRGSRFALVWDQDSRGQFSAWNTYTSGGALPPSYGGELRQADINELLKKYPVLGEAGERDLYRAIDRPAWGQLDRIHGACVLHTLAGPETYLPPAQLPSGGATGLPIIFVQLPNQTVGDTSGGSIGFYVLDAVRYIIQRTTDINRGDPGWTTTINVSLGSLGGPHDGSTIVEQALDEAVQAYAEEDGTQRVRIVMAAGNAAERQVHGVRDIAPGEAGQFHVMVPPGNPQESFVELWPQLAAGDDVDGLHVSVFAPDGSKLQSAQVGDIHVLHDSDDKVIASLVFSRAAAQGMHGPMILLAVRPTDNAEHPDDIGPYGTWTVQVESALNKPVTVHGWVERNDTIIRRRSPQRTVFIDSVAPGDAGGWLSNDSTLSSLANGELTDCVGGFEINRMRVTDHSSRGPELANPPRVEPGIYGASDATASLPGIAGPGFFSGTRARLSGTSAAAPRVARWIAEGEDQTKTMPLDAGHSTTARPGNPIPMGVKPLEEVDGALAQPTP